MKCPLTGSPDFSFQLSEFQLLPATARDFTGEKANNNYENEKPDSTEANRGNGEGALRFLRYLLFKRTVAEVALA